MEHCAEPSVGVSVALKKESAICPAAGPQLQLQPLQPPNSGLCCARAATTAIGLFSRLIVAAQLTVALLRAVP